MKDSALCFSSNFAFNIKNLPFALNASDVCSRSKFWFIWSVWKRQVEIKRAIAFGRWKDKRKNTDESTNSLILIRVGSSGCEMKGGEATERLHKGTRIQIPWLVFFSHREGMNASVWQYRD